MAVNVVAALRDALVTNITAAINAALGEVFSLETSRPSSATTAKLSIGRPRATAKKSRRQQKELTRWSPNRQARRVPKFVEEMTGFSLKNDIATKWGTEAVFEKGKALPKPLAGPGARSPATEASKTKIGAGGSKRKQAKAE